MNADGMMNTVAQARRLAMMEALEGCHVKFPSRKKGKHPRCFKPAACSELGKGNYGFKEFRMCARKDRYRSQGDAADKINKIHHYRPDEKLRVYLCPYCNGWHLTHSEHGKVA